MSEEKYCFHGLCKRTNQTEKNFLIHFVEVILPKFFNNELTQYQTTRWRWFLIQDFVALNPEIFQYSFDDKEVCGHVSMCGFRFVLYHNNQQLNNEILKFVEEQRKKYLSAMWGYSLEHRDHGDSKELVTISSSLSLLECLKFTAQHGKCVKISRDH
jgi:hypothetical protein